MEKVTSKNRRFSVSLERIEEDEMEGICLNCGCIRGECEPDARNYECHDCGKHEVFGLAEALLMNAIDIEPEEDLEAGDDDDDDVVIMDEE